VRWSSIGVHHIANACAVTAVAHALGVSLACIEQALASFAGVRRRMSLIAEVNGIRIFDDFAHHPTAITGVVSAAKAAMRQSDGTLWVVVEPRSNTMRSKVHQQRLPACFQQADRVIFTPPEHKPGWSAGDMLDVEQVCQDIGSKAQVLSNVEEIVAYLQSHAHAGDDILIFSNGAFDQLHQRLKRALG